MVTGGRQGQKSISAICLGRGGPGYSAVHVAQRHGDTGQHAALLVFHDAFNRGTRSLRECRRYQYETDEPHEQRYGRAVSQTMTLHRKSPQEGYRMCWLEAGFLRRRILYALSSSKVKL